ncbi:MAG: PorP/SprF family type IX secretion system membrane protein [Sediminicola sp.]|tara:strand:+ start:47232 stop:48812 length:1581 start_codon:yes stop_codon:yes gene_type:complete
MTDQKEFSLYGRKYRVLLFLGALFFLIPFSTLVNAQETNPYLSYKVPFQNLLKFNRFLINPTFSTVRENKSYINFYHRSQSAHFENNVQNYFLSYSGRINDRHGLGLSLYNQQEGVISNFGLVANYAYGIRLGAKSVLSFGVNIPYYRSNLNRNKVVVGEEDPLLNELGTSSVLMVQPGINLALGRFDVGFFAENLADFNFQSGESLSAFQEKVYSGHLQYTQNLSNADGLLESGRLLPLARVRVIDGGQMEYGGGIIMDLPKVGWLQGGYDSFYGASAGAGFNVGKRFSLGYNVEKGLSDAYDNFGVTHEISVALSFIPRLTEKMVYRQKEKQDRLAWERRSKEPVEPIEKGIVPPTYESDPVAVLGRTVPYLGHTDLERDSLQMARDHNGIHNMEGRAQLALSENKSDSAKHQFRDSQGVLTRKFGKIHGIEQGHYLIANVFGNKENVEKFMVDLKNRGLEAGYFKNPENGLFYAYLGHFKDGPEARKAYISNLDGKYLKDMWIMDIDNSRYSGMADLEFLDQE